ncbi:uncharacterized protein BO95DRAFT_46218 [Aspergillus brunneoviolaceus CBS 621.78]|uniref:Uncharacterized protein n=1 Tax=Aspergillus brunneoviolaceus CBS 621.78 TaxID=1450534 RepID=A0ACD1FRR0_9EURO|nr:hypothetical protein BO95DRAFT_46218 [Aspergillus brunneoviolaceus CBS 621.78]RAH39654.1 hypothetical protein BO95DRAFT_46218 [Aspergillus brunneoviolaceus CBS 621.78]
MAASIAPECNEIKEKYDTCFLKWYSEKYLRGNTTSNDCEELFTKYKTCLNVCASMLLSRAVTIAVAVSRTALYWRSSNNPANIYHQVVLKEKGIDSMLEDARKSTTKEFDAETLRRG